MLKHFVIFTFEPDYFKEDNLKEFREVFAAIKDGVDGVINASVRLNCVNRPANMDLMVEMDLTDESVLSQYLTYPAHIAMGQKYNPHITNRVSFDYEM